MQNELKNVSVIGLGKLGATMAACFAARGFNTIGVDVNEQHVGAMQNGLIPVAETGLQELINSLDQGKLRATLDIEDAVLNSDASFIIVPTPSESEGGFSLKSVLEVCHALGKVLKTKHAFHLIVLTSTVMPGSTGGPIRKTLERASGKCCGQHFGLCYSPEFIALGNIIHDFLNPDFFLIGESDSRSGAMLETFYQKMSKNNAPVARMNFVNAELAKLSVNTFVTTKITFANMLSRLCEHLPGGDVDAVTAALGLDRRIGSKYLKGAVGYGGPCFPRDNLALTALARQLGVQAPLAETTDRSNRSEVTRLAELVRHHLPEGGTAGILGLSYKPDTAVIEASQGILLAQALTEENIPIIAYDPAAMKNARQVLTGGAQFAESLKICIQASDVIVIITPWRKFHEIPPLWLERQGKPRVLIDCWRILPYKQFASVVEYIALGVNLQNNGVVG